MTRIDTGAGHQVLVVTPTTFYREMLVGLLERHGHSVASAANGSEALARLTRGPRPDLLLLDTSLVEPDCLELLGSLKEPGSIPSLLLARQFLEQAEFEPYRRLGASGWVAKASPIDELVLGVRAVLFPQDQNIRRAPRAQLRIPVSWQLTAELRHSHTFNLSADGMFIVTTSTRPEPLGTRLELTFWVPRVSQLIVCEGVVIWSNARGSRVNELYPPGMGVMFQGLAPELAAVIGRYVLEHKLGTD